MVENEPKQLQIEIRRVSSIQLIICIRGNKTF